MTSGVCTDEAERDCVLVEAAKPGVSVLVVDDHQTFADLLAIALNADPSLRYVGHARTAECAFRLAAELCPDVVLMDVQLPDLDGITATEQLLARHPELRVVILTAHTEPNLVARAAAAGAHGFLPKDGALRDVLQALHTAHRGGMVVSTGLLTGILAPTPPPRSAALPTALLTSREHEVLRLIGRGLDVRAVARDLNISPHTCRSYIKNILSKLNSHSQLEAVITAIRCGLISPHELT